MALGEHGEHGAFLMGGAPVFDAALKRAELAGLQLVGELSVDFG
jgi:hypothetical protein